MKLTDDWLFVLGVGKSLPDFTGFSSQNHYRLIFFLYLLVVDKLKIASIHMQ